MSKLSRSSRLLELLNTFEAILILAHNTPDPDAIASGWALAHLIQSKLERTPRFVAGGAVERAENVHMLRLLHPPLRLIDKLEVSANCAVILVDCIPTGGNHLFSDRDFSPIAVIDHHEPSAKRFRVTHRDIRSNVSATATIVSSYLLEQEVMPGTDLATALLYALRTDVKMSDPKLSPLDRRVISWLGSLADYKKLTEIENAPLNPRYYSDLVLALQNTFTYGSAAICFLPTATGAELAGEVADLLIRSQSLEQVLCAVATEEGILISARTTRSGGDVVSLLHSTLGDLGSFGGHAHRGGAKIPFGSGISTFDRELEKTLRERWLQACAVDERRGARLVAKREMLENL